MKTFLRIPVLVFPSVLFLVLCVGEPVFAQFGREMVDRAKAATALVERPSGDGFGTAFCIDARGFFLTNHHVVTGETERIPLILNPGTPDETRILVEIAKFDEDDLTSTV